MAAARAILVYPGRWLDAAGDLTDFVGRVFGEILNGRVFRYFGEVLRQAGILIVGSTVVIWGLMFIIGLSVGVEGAYFSRGIGAPSNAGIFSALANLREVLPLAFGWMMAAKVGTGLVAELGAMRINEEIDAMEVMGIRPITFLASTRLLAAWLVLPFVYLSGIGGAYLASYVVVVQQVGDISSGGYLQVFWQFQNPLDLIFSLTKAMVMATAIVAVGCYYGYTARGGPVGVGQATAKSMVLNIVLVQLIAMLLTAVFWGGGNANVPLGG